MESERTLQERDRILGEAEAEGKRIIAQARQRANEILSADALVGMARKEYERIVEDGRSAARQRAEEADAYTAQVLEELSVKLAQLTKQVDNGLQVMHNRRQSERRDAGPVVAPHPGQTTGAGQPSLPALSPQPIPDQPVARPSAQRSEPKG